MTRSSSVPGWPGSTSCTGCASSACAAQVIEAGDGVGGTWYWNRYPGARCDVQSLSYSYSFSPELEQEWDWTEKYPTQPEILRYLNHVADRFDLRPRHHLRHPGAQRALRRRHGALDGRALIPASRLTAQFLIMATGCLSASKLPEVPGLERYRGRTHHTAHWGKDEVRFDGLRVGVIGTGSSGIQSIPIIAEQAADLTVFQRTPNFSMPAGNRPLSAGEVAEMKANYRAWREAQRTSGFGIPSEPSTTLAMSVSEDERNATYQAGWDKGDLVSLIGSYADIAGRPGGQRDGGRVHPGQDPLDRAPIRTWPRRCRRARSRSAPSGPAWTAATTRRSTGRTCTWSTCARRRWWSSPRPACGPRRPITSSTPSCSRPASTR